jgi:heme/copper-type cytochrome/quinol oxidase subunit 2
MRYLFILPILLAVITIITFFLIRNFKQKQTEQERKRFVRKAAKFSIVLSAFAIVSALVSFFISFNYNSLFPITLYGLILFTSISTFNKNKG